MLQIESCRTLRLYQNEAVDLGAQAIPADGPFDPMRCHFSQHVLPQLQAHFTAATFTPVSAVAIDHRSPTQALTFHGSLLPEGVVYTIVQGFHGLVYVASRRRHSTKKHPPPTDGSDGTTHAWHRPTGPIVGRIYSAFLFDSYRRPFCCGRRRRGLRPTDIATQIANAWVERRKRAGSIALEKKLAMLIKLLHDSHVAWARIPTNLRHSAAADHRRLTATLKQDIATLQERLGEVKKQSVATPAMIYVHDGIIAALRPLCGRSYPTIDLFLHDLVVDLTDRLHAVVLEPGDTHRAFAGRIVDNLFTDLACSNSTKKLAQREIWPMYPWESWRTGADHCAALTLENHLAKKTAWHVFICSGALPRDTPGQEKQVAKLPRKCIMHHIEQPLRHASVQAAFRQYLLAKWYFDERMQRTVAQPFDLTLSLPPFSVQHRAAHQDAIRRRALATLDAEIACATRAGHPQLALLLQQQRVSTAAQASFPLFAHVPWRVRAPEMAEVQRHFCYFSQLPKKSNRQTGNCNAIAATLLKTAAAIEAETLGYLPKLRLYGWSGKAAIGYHHELALPRCKVKAERTHA